MPKYDFKCIKCEKVEERSCLTEDVGDQRCECEGKMIVLFSPQGISFQVRWGKPKVRQKVKRMGA